ncbi:hypothetical protein ACFE04_027950 [Oxalis oulophora]
MEVYKRATLSLCFAALLLSCNCMMTTITTMVSSNITVSNHFKLLNGLSNLQIPKWPKNVADPSGPLSLPRVFCFDDRAAQILVHNLGLGGSFSGLSELKLACSDDDSFSAIPLYFFQAYVKLINVSCVGCNLTGPLPEFIGTLKSLGAPLNLSNSRLYCEISANWTTLVKNQLNGDQIVSLVPEILANMELGSVARGSSITDSPQSPKVVGMKVDNGLLGNNQVYKRKVLHNKKKVIRTKVDDGFLGNNQVHNLKPLDYSKGHNSSNIAPFVLGVGFLFNVVFLIVNAM